MARPKSITTKAHDLHVRVDDETLKQLDTICRRRNMTRSSAMRCSIYALARGADTGGSFTAEEKEVIQLFMQFKPLLSKLLLQTQRIGVNINQIAKHNNSYTGIAQGITTGTVAELRKIQSHATALAEGLEIRSGICL